MFLVKGYLLEEIPTSSKCCKANSFNIFSVVFVLPFGFLIVSDLFLGAAVGLNSSFEFSSCTKALGSDFFGLRDLLVS